MLLVELLSLVAVGVGLWLLVHLEEDFLEHLAPTHDHGAEQQEGRPLAEEAPHPESNR
jgi:hypothetical protein